MRIVLRPEGQKPIAEARPWRDALHEIMKPSVVMRLQLPVMASMFTARVRALALAKAECMWYWEARRLAFTVAARSALGSIVSDNLLEPMFADMELMGKGAFSLVRCNLYFVSMCDRSSERFGKCAACACHTFGASVRRTPV